MGNWPDWSEWFSDWLEWFSEQSGWLAFGAAIVLYGITLILWFGFGWFWPMGFVIGTVLIFIGMMFGE